MLSSELYIFSYLVSRPGATAVRYLTVRMAASLCDWLYQDPRPQTGDWLRIFSRPCIYDFTTPTYSDCHTRYVLVLICIGASCNHIISTAGTSSYVKGQYGKGWLDMFHFNILISWDINTLTENRISTKFICKVQVQDPINRLFFNCVDFNHMTRT